MNVNIIIMQIMEKIIAHQHVIKTLMEIFKINIHRLQVKNAKIYVVIFLLKKIIMIQVLMNALILAKVWLAKNLHTKLIQHILHRNV